MPSKPATGCSNRPRLCARAAADPAPFEGGDVARGAHARKPALAIADHIGRFADAPSWVQRGRGREAVCTSEPTGVSVDARWHAVIGTVAV